jgi:hypothetical protein
MKTKFWIERVIIQQIAYHDRRYKHNYQSRKESTAGFVVDCGYLENMSTGEDNTASLGEAAEIEKKLESEVEDALRTLRERNLITKAGEQPRGGLFSEEDLGSTDLWELTEKGLKEANELNEAYSRDLDAFEEQYGELDPESANELISLSKKYGVVPDI